MEKIEACQGKMEATTKAGQERMKAEIKTGLKEMKFTDSEANQERQRP
jgi:hypothetical protein